MLLDGSENITSDQTITITLKKYNELVQLIPQLEKLKTTVKRMEEVIKKKDAKLKEMDNKWINLPTVSKRYSINSKTFYSLFKFL